MTPEQFEDAKRFIDSSGLKVNYHTKKFTSKKTIVDITFDQLFTKTICDVMAFLWNQNNYER